MHTINKAFTFANNYLLLVLTSINIAWLVKLVERMHILLARIRFDD